jgi:hypothetical protein
MSSHDTSNYSSAESKAANDAAEAVRKAFAALPLDQKFATLLRVEFDMLGDAVDTVVEATSRAVDEIAEAFSRKPHAGAGPADSQATPI